MNKDTAKDYLPLVQALAEGKVIQAGSDKHGWEDIRDDEDCGFSLSACSYRIKPKLKEIWVNEYTDRPSSIHQTEAYARMNAMSGAITRRYREVIE